MDRKNVNVSISDFNLLINNLSSCSCNEGEVCLSMKIVLPVMVYGCHGCDILWGPKISARASKQKFILYFVSFSP